MDREKSGFEPVTFWIPMADTVQSLTPSGLEIVQCRLQSQFVVDNCRARTECRTDVSGYLRTILGPYTGRFFQEKPLFLEKTTSKGFITGGGCKTFVVATKKRKHVAKRNTLETLMIKERPQTLWEARQSNKSLTKKNYVGSVILSSFLVN